MAIPIKELNAIISAIEIIAGSHPDGSELINDTSAHTGNYGSIIFLEDTVFTTLTGNHTGWSGVTYPSGLVLNGQFSEIELASGSIIVYKR